MMVKGTRMFENPYRTYCDVYHCRNRAAYFVGRPDATKSATYKICDECATEILANLNEDLAKKVSVDFKDQVKNLSEKPNTSEAQEQMKDMPMPEQAKPELNSDFEEDGALPIDGHAPTEAQEYGPQEAPQPVYGPQEAPKPGHSVEESQIDQSLKEQLQKKTVDELKEMAKDVGVPKYYEMKKSELVEALAKGDNNE